MKPSQPFADLMVVSRGQSLDLLNLGSRCAVFTVEGKTEIAVPLRRMIITYNYIMHFQSASYVVTKSCSNLFKWPTT